MLDVDVDELSERRHAKAQRRAEDHPRLGREPAGLRERQIGAPEAARQQPYEIEVAEERRAADLGEPDAVRRVRRARADVPREPHALGALGLAIIGGGSRRALGLAMRAVAARACITV